MNAHLGTFALGATVLAAAVTMVLSLAGYRFANPSLVKAGRRGIWLLAALLTLASVVLMNAMLNSDFAISYVARFTERTLPTGYKFAAFWAGQEGSLLLWAWLLGAMSLVFVIVNRRADNREQAAANLVLAGVIGFFAALMLFAANPFTTLPEVPPDGMGLNPMLQDPGMIVHPPLLFIGYAGFTIPFALAVGALMARRSDSNWVARSRVWTLVAWGFLGAGILLGAQWAYVELGWGGYWAWDPVENASLLPWLTGTAMLHSMVAYNQRGMFKRWTVSLTTVTFLLCIFGTWITRSGVVSSVHTFGKSLVGTFFGVFLIIAIALALALVIVRWRTLADEHRLESLVSRDGFILAGNIILSAMTAVTLVGTMFPAISQALGKGAVEVQQSFYNKAVLPMGLAAVALMALAPMLLYGGAEAGRSLKRLIAPVVLGIVAVPLVLVWIGLSRQITQLQAVWAGFTTLVAVVAVSVVVIDLVRRVIARSRLTGENLAVAATMQVALNHRRYGAHVAHLGVIMIVVGIAGSSLFVSKETVQLTPGQTLKVQGYQFTYHLLREVRGDNYTTVEAAMTVTTPSGDREQLLPERRYYDKAENPSSEVAIRSSWRQDLYVMLAGWEDAGRITTFQVIVNPLVWWIWVGGIVLSLGTIVCMAPRLAARTAVAAAAPAGAVQASPVLPAGAQLKRA